MSRKPKPSSLGVKLEPKKIDREEASRRRLSSTSETNISSILGAAHIGFPLESSDGNQLQNEVDLTDLTPDQFQVNLNMKKVPKIISEIIVNNNETEGSSVLQGLLKNQTSESIRTNSDKDNKETTSKDQEMLDDSQENVPVSSGNTLQSQNQNDMEKIIAEYRKMYDFTSDFLTDQLEINDSTCEYIGFVDYVGKPIHIKNHGHVFHIVLNNLYERRIMVSAWKELIPKLEKIAEKGNVIEARGVMAKNKESMKYSLGSSLKFFEVQDFSTFEILGKLPILPQGCGVTTMTFDCIEESQGLIKIEGTIKTPPRLNVNKYGSKVVGGISNGKKVIEFQLPEQELIDHINKGECVRILGKVTKKYGEVHLIKVESANDIMKIPGETICDLQWFLNANEHV